VKQEDAAAMVVELGCLKDFPMWNPSALEKIAENLARWCKTTAEARRLVDELTSGRFAEWPGPGVMKDVYQELFPQDEYQTPEWMKGNPPKITCGQCDDTGALHDTQFNWTRCQCDAGQAVEQSYIDKLNELTDQSRDLRRRAKLNCRPTDPAQERVMREVLEIEHARKPEKAAEAKS
jgi:hypothetical protein